MGGRRGEGRRRREKVGGRRWEGEGGGGKRRKGKGGGRKSRGERKEKSVCKTARMRYRASLCLTRRSLVVHSVITCINTTHTHLYIEQTS